MRNKRGWIHILEATIAVMLVAGVMMTIYSDQSGREDFSIAEYSYSLQNEILDSITINRNLRMEVLRVGVDNYTDPYFTVLDNAITAAIPSPLDHLLRVCNLGDPDDPCKMPPIIFTATLDKNIFVEEAIVSSELGDGTDAVFSPKKVRLFFWEGEAEFVEGECVDECSDYTTSCSLDFKGILNVDCVEGADSCFDKNIIRDDCNFEEICNPNSVTCVSTTCSNTCSESAFCSGGDVWEASCVSEGDCLKIGDTAMVEDCGDNGCFDGACGDDVQVCVETCSVDRIECSASGDKVVTLSCVDGCLDNSVASEQSCGTGKSCVNGGCVDVVDYGWQSVCEKKVIAKTGCVEHYDTECDGYGGGERTGGCGFLYTDDLFACWNFVYETSGCEASVPGCSNGYTFDRKESCVL